MKNNIGFLILAFLIVSCKDNSILEYSKQEFEAKLNENCEEYCTQAKLDIAYFDSKTPIADSINLKTFNFFKEVICFGEEPCVVNSYDELLSAFIASYTELKKDMPHELIGWEATGKSDMFFRDEHLINIRVEYYIFTGGAHGYSGTGSLIFDIKTGRQIQPGDLILNLDKFKSLAEQKFREKYKITPESNINATGFMFENEVFELPANIFFTDKGLLLYYNTYEIAAYVDGPQELLIVYEDLKGLLKS